MNAALWLIRKDLGRFFADRNGVFASIVMPIVLGAFLGTLFAPREGPNPVALAWVHATPTAASRRFEAELRKSAAVSLEAMDEAAARDAVRRGKKALAVVVQARSGPTPGVLIVSDPSRGAEADLARGMVEAALYRSMAAAFSDPADRVANTQGLASLLGAAGVSDAGRAADVMAGLVTQLGSGESGALAIQAETAGAETVGAESEAGGGAPKYNTYAHNFAGMLCMFLLFFGIEQAKERLGERTVGLDRRVAMSPVGRSLPLLASGLSTVLLALFVSVAVFTVAIVGFGVRISGSLPGFALVLVAQAVFTGGFSMALFGWISSPRAIQGAGSAFALIASFLGGAWMPSFVLPAWCQQVAIVLPTRWATEGFAATTWRGLGFDAAWLPALILVALGGVLGVVGAAGARRRG